MITNSVDPAARSLDGRLLTELSIEELWEEAETLLHKSFGRATAEAVSWTYRQAPPLHLAAWGLDYRLMGADPCYGEGNQWTAIGSCLGVLADLLDSDDAA